MARRLQTDSLSVKRSKAERSDRTRNAIIETARQLFTRKGYAATSTEELIKRAGTSRGGLYHHFRDKEDVFCAVFERVQREAYKRALAVATEPDPWKRLIRASLEYVDASMDPSFQQIVILDGPSVLSRPLLDNLQENSGALPLGQGMLRMCLQESMDNGIIEPERAWALAYLISGALENISRVIAMSPEGLKQVNRKILASAFVRFIERLRIDRPDRKDHKMRARKKPVTNKREARNP
jgi:AcrR family transcriptional regulator